MIEITFALTAKEIAGVFLSIAFMSGAVVGLKDILFTGGKD